MSACEVLLLLSVLLDDVAASVVLECRLVYPFVWVRRAIRFYLNIFILTQLITYLFKCCQI